MSKTILSKKTTHISKTDHRVLNTRMRCPACIDLNANRKSPMFNKISSLTKHLVQHSGLTPAQMERYLTDIDTISMIIDGRILF